MFVCVWVCDTRGTAPFLLLPRKAISAGEERKKKEKDARSREKFGVWERGRRKRKMRAGLQ